MPRMNRRPISLALLLSLSLCGCLPNLPTPRSAAERDEILKEQELGGPFSSFCSLFPAFERRHQRPPASWDEMKGFQEENGTVGLYDALRDLGFEATWGASVQAYVDADDDLAMFVLLYERDVAEKGGWVGFANGSSRKVTGEEFATLPLLGKTPPGSVPAANLEARLLTALDDLGSINLERVNAGLAALETVRRYKAPRQHVADALVRLRQSGLMVDDNPLVDALGHWALLEHLPLLRELDESRRYQSDSLTRGIGRLDQEERTQKSNAEWAARWSSTSTASPRGTTDPAGAADREGEADPDGAADREGEAPAEPGPRSPAPSSLSSRSTAQPTLTPDEQRAQWLADLRSGQYFTIKAAAEALQNATQAVADEEVTAALVPLLENSSPFVRQPAVGALKKWGTANCLDALRDLLRSGAGGTHEKRDTLAALRHIERRLGLADEPGDPVRSNTRLRPGDKVFVQTPEGWVPGKVVQSRPRGFYQVMIGEEGFGQTGDVASSQLRLPKKPAANSAPAPSGDAVASSSVDPFAAAEFRVWTDSSGNFSIAAQFVACENGQVQLRKQTDGQLISLPLEKLSAADREHVASITDR